MNLRMTGAVVAISAMIALLYILSPLPYLVGGGEPSSSLPLLQIIIPALTLPLILLLVFVVPKRRASLDAASGSRARDMAEYRFRKKSLLSGAAAGCIAASVLVGLILAGDSFLGLPTGTFYSIIGISMAGLDIPASIYFGVVLHIITGTLVGSTFGYMTSVTGPFNITGIAKGAGVGVLAGFITFSLLFIPLTRFGVEPSLLRILSGIYPADTSQIVLQNKAVDIMSSVLAGAILLHIVYGAIMGVVTSVLLSRTKKEEEIPPASSSIPG